jgi:hypothetical protein
VEARLTWLKAGSLDLPDVICLVQTSCPERKRGSAPLAYRMLRAAVQAFCRGKLSSAPRASGPGLESVKRLPALSTFPEFAQRRCRLARWAGKSLPARQLCKTQQGTRLLQTAPAIHQYEDGDDPQPEILPP